MHVIDFVVSVCEAQFDIIDYTFNFCHIQKMGRDGYQEN